MQLLLSLKGSPLVGATILNFVTPEKEGENKVTEEHPNNFRLNDSYSDIAVRCPAFVQAEMSTFPEKDFQLILLQLRCDKIEYCRTDQ